MSKLLFNELWCGWFKPKAICRGVSLKSRSLSPLTRWQYDPNQDKILVIDLANAMSDQWISSELASAARLWAILLLDQALLIIGFDVKRQNKLRSPENAESCLYCSPFTSFNVEPKMGIAIKSSRSLGELNGGERKICLECLCAAQDTLSMYLWAW